MHAPQASDWDAGISWQPTKQRGPTRASRRHADALPVGPCPAHLQVGRYIQARGGTVVAEELAPFLDLRPGELAADRGRVTGGAGQGWAGSACCWALPGGGCALAGHPGCRAGHARQARALPAAGAPHPAQRLCSFRP